MPIDLTNCTPAAFAAAIEEGLAQGEEIRPSFFEIGRTPADRPCGCAIGLAAIGTGVRTSYAWHQSHVREFFYTTDEQPPERESQRAALQLISNLHCNRYLSAAQIATLLAACETWDRAGQTLQLMIGLDRDERQPAIDELMRQRAQRTSAGNDPA